MEKSHTNFKYPVQFFNPHVKLEYNDYVFLDLNEAERKALKHEEYQNKFFEMKKLKNKQYMEKYNINTLLYQNEQKLKEKEEQNNKKEKLLKKESFNRTVYEKNMRPFNNRNIKSSKTLDKPNKIINYKAKEIKEINDNNDDINFNDIELNLDKKEFSPKRTFLKGVNTQLSVDETNKDYDLNLNLNEKKLKEKLENDLDIENKIIDLRGNIENQLLKEYKNKNRYNDNELRDEINDKISNIKRFRTHGLLPVQNKIVEKKKKNVKKNKKFVSEFERIRYIKAMKNIFTERLGEHNIYIQNICSCGNLQKQLTAIVEKGNLTVYALTNVECANNCVFYKNKKEYLKGINDVLNSIKNISYENFHNKYKDKI